MIYSRNNTGRREGDCVIHVPPQYGGSLFSANAAVPLISSVREPDDAPEPTNEFVNEPEAPVSSTALPDGGMVGQTRDAELGRPAVRALSAEDLLLTGMILLLLYENGTDDIILIAVLAALLIFF